MENQSKGRINKITDTIDFFYLYPKEKGYLYFL